MRCCRSAGKRLSGGGWQEGRRARVCALQNLFTRSSRERVARVTLSVVPFDVSSNKSTSQPSFFSPILTLHVLTFASPTSLTTSPREGGQPRGTVWGSQLGGGPGGNAAQRSVRFGKLKHGERDELTSSVRESGTATDWGQRTAISALKHPATPDGLCGQASVSLSLKWMHRCRALQPQTARDCLRSSDVREDQG